MEEFDIIKNNNEFNSINNEYLSGNEYEYIEEKMDDPQEFYNEIKMDESEEKKQRNENSQSDNSQSDNSSAMDSSSGGTASSNSITLHGVSGMSAAVSAIAVCVAASGASYYSGNKDVNMYPQHEYVESSQQENIPQVNDYPYEVQENEEIQPEIVEDREEIIMELPKEDDNQIVKTMDISSEDYDGIYDGEGHTGTILNIPDGAQVTYGESRDAITLENPPEYTDSGKYTVYYMVEKEGYETYIGSYIVTIEKKIVIPPTPEVIVGTYNGKMQIPVLENSEDYKCRGELSAVDAGKYEMNVSLPDYKNYEWSDGNFNDKTVTWIIKPRIISLEWQEKNHFLYDGQTHTIYVTLGNVVPGDFLNFTVQGNKGSDPGIYKAEVISFEGSGNYILPEKCSYRWSINKEDNVIIENEQQENR